MVPNADTLHERKKTPNKLILGVAAFLTTGIIAASGLAGATAANPTDPMSFGYGGNTSVVTNIDLHIENSNNNIIQVIVNIFR